MMSAWPINERLSRALARSALLAALALLSWTLAHWTWRWWAPAPAVQVLPQPGPQALQRLAEAQLFGEEKTAAAATPQPPASTTGTLRLLGVMAREGGGGWALFRLGSGNVRLVREGDEPESGRSLRRVAPDGVTLLDAQGEHRMLLREAKAELVNTGSAAKLVACPLKAGERKVAYLLHPELLAGIVNRPESQAALFRNERGGLRVTGKDALLAAMGLMEADLIEAVDGAAVTGSDALTTAIVEPLARNRVLHLSGQRAGKPLGWIYVNAAIC